MRRGTCSICGREFDLTAEGTPIWHLFEDAPAYALNHPQIHRDDRCLGVMFPCLERSPRGTREGLGTLQVLELTLREELQEWETEGIDSVWSESAGRLLYPNDIEFPEAERTLLEERRTTLNQINHWIDRYQTWIRPANSSES